MGLGGSGAKDCLTGGGKEKAKNIWWKERDGNCGPGREQEKTDLETSETAALSSL